MYVDVAGLQSAVIVPRGGYIRYLHALIDNGFTRRIMFGSDFPDQLESGIEAIIDADFLAVGQKKDLLCGNALDFCVLSCQCAIRD